MRGILKTVLFCLAALIIATVSGVGSYIITTNILGKSYRDIKNEEKKVQAPPHDVAAVAEAKPVTETEKKPDMKFSSYTVKLEDDILNIYVNYEEHEELLYGEKINVGDLSDADLLMLKNGVEFQEMSKVTELTENFTS